jgi:hypothetical protein
MSNRMMGRALAGVAIVTMALAGAEAFALTCTASKTSSSQTCCSWKKTTSGYTYCALWCTGSELFTNTMTGVGGNIFGSCDPAQLDTVCPETSNQAFGTVDPTTGAYDPDGPCNTSLGLLDPSCAIKGLAFCQNKGGNSKVKNSQVQGSPFLVTGVLGLDVPLVPTDCDKQGKCSTSGKLEADLSAITCQNDNWTPLTFTASEFKAKACFCPGGYAGDGTTCCATTARSTDPATAGTCGEGNLWAGTGVATCMVALCSVDLAAYNPLTSPSLPYDCHPDGMVICGGDSGITCP